MRSTNGTASFAGASEATSAARPSSRDSKDWAWWVLKNIRKNWPVVVATMMLSAGAALIYAKSAIKIYQASSLIEIDPNPVQPIKDTDVLDMGAGNYWSIQEYYTTQYKLIVSDRVLGKVVKNLGLAADYDFLGLPSAPPQPMGVSEVADALRKHVTVDPVKGSRLVSVKVEDRDPRRAKRVCDAITTAYIEQNLETAVNSSEEAVAWLGGQVDNVKHELEKDENALYGFKRENDLPSTSINETSNMLRVEMQELDTALTQTRTKKEEIAARFAELSKVSAENADQLPASELLGSIYLQGLRKEYQEAEKDRVSLLAAGRGENHPDVKMATGRVAETKAALLAEVANIKGAVERDLAAITRQEAAEAGLFETTRKRAVDLNMREIEYHRLDRARDQNEKLYGMLLDRTKDADLARMMRVNNLHVVDAASEPKYPVRPRSMVIVSIGSFVGLLVGLVLAFVREQLDSSVKTPGDVEQVLGQTFLGLLPAVDGTDDKQPKAGRRTSKRAAVTPGGLALIVHERPMSGTAEAARSVRTNLMFMNPDRPYKKILISSAAPSEGKTTVACSIAIAFAQGGQRVCIIDCDLRRPRLHRIFGRAGDAGITSVLMETATIDEVAKPTTIANLWSIPAGPLPPNPADLLHSERFKRLLQELGERFDRVIVDSPPVVAVTDAAIISTLVDGTVFVVRGSKTPRNLAFQGLHSLYDVDASVIGIVLNAVDLNSNEYNYYYHYYYYRREGYHSNTPGSDAPDPSASASPPN